MARARNIKPGFFANEDLVEMDFSTRLLFIGLWTIADRAGRLEDRPKRIKMALFPADNIDIDAALDELQSAGFLLRYEHVGGRYIQVLAFEKHQNPHRDERASTIPAPCEHGASTVQESNEHDGNPADSPNPDSPNPDSIIKPPAATPAGSAAVFEPPIWIPPETWAAYCKTRAGKKAKNEPHALGLIVADLEKFKALGYDPVEILNSSIKSGWAGVFEPKQQARGSPGYQSIHDKRAETIAILTGKKSNERTSATERDITGESLRVE